MMGPDSRTGPEANRLLDHPKWGKVFDEGFHRWVALFLVLAQGFQNDSFERNGTFRDEFPYRRRLLLQNAQQQCGMVFTGERPLIGDNLVENDSQRPNITTRVGVLLANLFGGHVSQRAE